MASSQPKPNAAASQHYAVAAGNCRGSFQPADSSSTVRVTGAEQYQRDTDRYSKRDMDYEAASVEGVCCQYVAAV